MSSFIKDFDMKTYSIINFLSSFYSKIEYKIHVSSFNKTKI